LPPAPVVQINSLPFRRPIFEDAHELPTAQERLDQGVEGVGDPKPTEGGADRRLRVVDRYASTDGNALLIAALLKSPAKDLAIVGSAMFYAVVR
jgi:hypothetical protein